MKGVTPDRLKLIHQDDRRSITETVFDLAGGQVCRLNEIKVARPDTRLGDHYHPGHELFLVEQGSCKLYTAHRTTPNQVEMQRLYAGESVQIEAGVIHTFVCEVNTVLKSIAHTPFDSRWIIAQKLDLTLAH